MRTWEELEKKDILGRVQARDASLWKADRNAQDAIKNRLGWLTSAALMKERLPEIEGFVREVAGEKFSHVLLLGMGGSSLAPELFARTFPSTKLELHVLDSTAPEAVRLAERALPLDRTLFIVATKSGGTIETLSFFHHFHSLVPSGRNWAAITDHGSSLEKLAMDKGFRRIFLNPEDIGGRYSALSFFGLVPAALHGVDVARVIDRAMREDKVSFSGGSLRDCPGAFLGAEMGLEARGGRDKLTLVCAPALASFGAWVEQLVAESTGKEGRGIVPVDGEPLGDPDAYGADRFFLSLELEEDAATSAKLRALKARGQKVVRFRLRDPHDLGALFFRLELATAVAGAVLEVNPFDEPNVSESKQTTGQLLARWRDDPASPRIPPQPPSEVPGFLASARRNDYVAVLPYIADTPARRPVLQQIQAAIRATTRCATTVGFGPRYLHSTGQLHKGGPNQGIFVLLTADDLPEGGDVPVPGQGYTFGTLRDAQAEGDLEVLRKRSRRAIKVHLPGGPDAGLASLLATLTGSAR